MTRWFYTSGKHQKGPVSFEELRRLANEGLLQPADLVWQEGMKDWVKASSQGLFQELPRPSPPERSAPRWEKPADETPRQAKPLRVDDSYEDPPRRRFRDEGMPVGIKIGMFLGCTVVVLVVAGVGLYVGLASANRGPIAGGGHIGLGTFNALLGQNDPFDRVSGNPGKNYTIQLNAGRSYTIDVQSKGFAAFLRVEDSNFNQVAGVNAGNIGAPAQVVFTPPRTGVYRIVVTSVIGGAGPYTLRIREGAFWK